MGCKKREWFGTVTMPNLARHLQEVFAGNCPAGWVCRGEVKVVRKEVERWLGYAPQADVMLEETTSGRRIWVELEISRADPVANHAKFATAHLFEPMPTTNTFVSMVSRHVDRGRSSLAAHTIGLMRAIGIRAFQTVLLPAMDQGEIKRLNHLPMPQLREQAPSMAGEVSRVLGVAQVLGSVLDSDLHLVANLAEVLFNVRRWNDDILQPELLELWGRRRVRYFACDHVSGQFAPSKFAAYLRLPAVTYASWLQDKSLTGMNIRSYTEIDALNPIFDGRRAWTHLETNLGMTIQPLSEAEPSMASAFDRWVANVHPAIQVDAKGAVLVSPAAWQ